MNSREAAVQRLEHLLQRETGRIMIGMAGLPGSGKSTLAEELSSLANFHLGPGTVVHLGMDGFHYPRAYLAQMPDPEAAFRRRGAPWTFDAPALAGRLSQVRENYGREPVPWPQFRHGVGDPEEGGEPVPPEARIVLVEGLYLLLENDDWALVTSQFDEHWYLDTPLEIALERLILRHMRSWNLLRTEAEERVQRNDALNAQIVLATRGRACFLLD